MEEKIMDIGKIAEALHLAYRQENALYLFIDTIKHFFANGFSPKKIIATIVALCEFLGCIVFDTPITPCGEALNLDGYSLVLNEEFEGTELNTDIWNYRASGARRGGFNGKSQVEVKDGNLYLTAEYLENGEYGPGWYAAMISLKEYYKQGYFEIKCKVNKDKGFWSAFWIQSPIGPYDHYISQGGVNGAEIDIFEAMNADMRLPSNRNSVTQTIHCNGVDDDIENIDSRCLGDFKVGNDIYETYNTYGLKWTEDEYIFYINGIESARSSFGKGVSQIPEEVIVSLELPDNIPFEKGYSTQMVVDYVKIYQK